MARTLPRGPALSASAASQLETNVAQQHAVAAIASSLYRQIDTAWMLLQVANRFPPYEASHDRFVRSSARVLRLAEAQLWQVKIEKDDLMQLASNVEGLWFAIDALS